MDPLTRVSEHFILLDFLGNHSVYSRGYANPFIRDPASLKKWDNLKALANHGLEAILSIWGPLTIAYGYISPALSRHIVKYQDPDKPSHHRFDLGAAVDVCAHQWVDESQITLGDLFLPESVQGAPVVLAHGIDQAEIPYSRLITYSESPYICLAISADEVYKEQPRKAFYENRYQGRAKEKPEYIQLSNQGARNRHFAQLQEQGLEHPWQGAGYPTYHGGGFRQYQHMRVSKFTMVSDWLVDLQSIANGAKNIPSLNEDAVQDSFAAAGIVYDWIVSLGFKRLSIVSGYVSPQNPSFEAENDWRGKNISFDFMPPASTEQNVMQQMLVQLPNGAYAQELEDGLIRVNFQVEEVLTNTDWDV